MELVKQIKAAENEAAQYAQQAREHVKSCSEQAKAEKDKKFAAAENTRRRALSEASQEAEKEALQQAQQIKQQTEEKCQQIMNNVSGKLDSATGKILNYIRSLANN